MLSFKELQTKEEWLEAYPVMKQLRTHLDEASYLDLIKDAKKVNEYRLIALYDEATIVAVTGFIPMITLYNGKSIWVCDLVTDTSQRSKGYGDKLLSYVHEWAANHGYERISLSSGLKRHHAHRFYENKMNYDKVSYVFLKKL